MFCFAILVAVVTFVLSFHGLDDYGRSVAGLDDLAWLVPLGVDGLTLTAIAATFLLARAPFKVRLYAWVVFGAANAASVAGNLSHANARQLPWDGAVGAAAWPIFLTLASHLAIVTRRWLSGGHSDTAVATPATPAVVADVAPAETHASDTSTEEVPAAPRRTRTPKPRPNVTRNATGNQSVARRRVAAGESCATVALSLGVSKKTVERWTGDIREQRQATATPAGDRSGSGDADRQMTQVR